MAGGDNKTKMQDSSQDSKKNKDKKKKGKDAAVEAITNALKALPQDQQVATVLSKYAELVEENRTLQVTCRSLERTSQQALKDKDRVELEHSKAVLTRSRLESLCRELQRQNKLIKDENVVRLKEEEERRKEVSSQFNSTLSEISHLMDENTQNNTKLRDENQKMATRLQDLVGQHEKREDHVEKVLKQRELETQLAEAKLAKLHIEIREQREKMLVERKGLLEEMSILQDKLQEKALTEITLRTQLNSYTEKFEEFQGTFDKSNQIFNGFKKEIDDMSKTIKLLEKETKTWKDKCESANVALCQMFNDRSQLEARIETQTKQNTQLQSLCRALQQQIKELRSQMRTQGIPESPTPAPTDELLSADPSDPDKTPSPPPEGEAPPPTLEADPSSTPATPETPGNTVTSTTPETSVTPTTPGNPATPTTPATSATPGNSTTPAAPMTPGNPVTPATPTTPGNPTTPATPTTPGNPATPATPTTPGNPATPDPAPSNPEDQNSTDCESNGTLESELDMETVD